MISLVTKVVEDDRDVGHSSSLTGCARCYGCAYCRSVECSRVQLAHFINTYCSHVFEQCKNESPMSSCDLSNKDKPTQIGNKSVNI